MESLSPAGRTIFREEEFRSSRTVNRVRYLMVLLLIGPIMITAFSSTDPYVSWIYTAAILVYLGLTYIHTLALRDPRPGRIRRWNLLAMLGDMTIAISVIIYWGLAISPHNIGFMAKIPIWNFMALIILTTIFQFNPRVTYYALGICLAFHVLVSAALIYTEVPTTSDWLLYIDGPMIDPVDLILTKPMQYIIIALIVTASVKKTFQLIIRTSEAEAHKAAVEKELEMARAIQRASLPATRSFPAQIRISTLHEPMIQVGGDYYDFHVTEKEVGILMCDVSGHGMPAALIVSMLHLLFSTQKKGNVAPEKILENMNAMLLGNIETQFVTATYISYDTGTGMATITNGGHPPALLYRGNTGSVESLRPFGRPLGLFDNGEYRSQNFHLEQGDRLLIFTDGLIEAENSSGQMLKESGVIEFLCDNAELTGDGLLQGLRNHVSKWTGGSTLDDDIAMILFELQGSGK